jgi:hypothetical protein
MTETKDFNWITNNGYFNRLRCNDGDNPGKNLFLLDTGTVIDMEDFYHTRTLRKDARGEKHPSKLLCGIASSNPLIVTLRVVEEVRDHSKCKVNGHRMEICYETKLAIEMLYTFESGPLLDSANFSLNENDSCAYQVHLAARSIFRGDTRKGEKEEVSYTDEELVKTAFLLTKRPYGRSPVSWVNILSPDEHIPRLVNALRGSDKFKDYRVRAIPTRHDLRSYLS